MIDKASVGVVLCDTSPIFYLHQVGHLELLPQLFGEIHVPKAVLDELLAGAKLGYSVPGIDELTWLIQDTVEVAPAFQLIHDLGEGELQVMSLALSHPSSLLILDDFWVREVATAHGLAVTGTIGVLLLAKSAKHITKVRPILDQLRDAGFYLKDPLYQRILKQIQE